MPTHLLRSRFDFELELGHAQRGVVRLHDLPVDCSEVTLLDRQRVLPSLLADQSGELNFAVSLVAVRALESLQGGKDESEARESGKRALVLDCAVERGAPSQR